MLPLTLPRDGTLARYVRHMSGYHRRRLLRANFIGVSLKYLVTFIAMKRVRGMRIAVRR